MSIGLTRETKAMRARKNAELEESVTRMAAMLKSGAWAPMNLTGHAADLH